MSQLFFAEECAAKLNEYIKNNELKFNHKGSVKSIIEVIPMTNMDGIGVMWREPSQESPVYRIIELGTKEFEDLMNQGEGQ